MIQSPPASLTTPQQRVTTQLVYGPSNKAIAARLELSVHTVNAYMQKIRHKLHAPYCSQAVLVSALLNRRMVPSPPSAHPAPDFTDTQKLLLQALARYSRKSEIAEASKLASSAVRDAIRDLVAKAKADNPAHAVALGYTWGLLSDASSTQPVQATGRTR